MTFFYSPLSLTHAYARDNQQLNCFISLAVEPLNSFPLSVFLPYNDKDFQGWSIKPPNMTHLFGYSHYPLFTGDSWKQWRTPNLTHMRRTPHYSRHSQDRLLPSLDPLGPWRTCNIIIKLMCYLQSLFNALEFIYTLNYENYNLWLKAEWCVPSDFLA